MKYKKGLIFIFLILFFLSIAGVCASDAGEVNIQTGNGTVDDVVALDVDSDENDDAIASDVVNGQDMMAISDEHEILNSGFNDLQEYINDADEGSEIHIHNNYTLQEGEGSINISKSITIIGDNNFIKGSDKDTIFKIVADGKSVTLKNLLIQNGKTSGDGGAILNTHSSTNLTLIDCEFRDNHADDDGGAIFTDGNLLIVHTNFYYNHAALYGGAIRSEGAIRIYGSQLHDNSASTASQRSLGGAISSGSDCYIEEGDFKNNHADNFGGAIFSIGALTIANSTFIDNEVADGGGAINSRGVTVISDTEFKNNHARHFSKVGYGGAIKSDNKCTLNSCTFDHNWADCGGAIFAAKVLKINGNSKFINQNGLYKKANMGFGGAIYCRANLYINWNDDNDSFCEMTSNVVNNFGGAIFCLKSVFGKNLKFQYNDVLDYACGNYLGGGAIACRNEIHIINSEFLDNHVFIKFNGIDPPSPSQPVPYDLFSNPCEGGAIRCQGRCYIDSCTFNGNSAFRGGAIYAISDLIITGNDNKFINNIGKFVNGPTYDSSSGGAIYCEGNLKVDGASFTGNEALVDGGAIYCEGTCEISNSEFNNSKIDDSKAFFSNAHKCHGGAIRSIGFITVDNCTFINNHANNWGGAIYADMGIKIVNCEFTRNKARVDGGAIYSCKKTDISNSIFEFNKAMEHKTSYGGAVRSKELVTVNNCEFNNNSAKHWGGAIYADGEIRITNSNFTGNNANSAGAVYAATIKEVSHSIFIKNKASAKDGNGGAICIWKKCNPEFYSCRFEGNDAKNTGGSIYLNSYYANLKVSYCTFIDNNAHKLRYKNLVVRCGAGHSIFNKGKYKLIDMCWFGTNNPNFKEQFVEKHTGSNDEDQVPKNYLKIALEINETDIYVGNTYKSTVYFISTQGNKLNKDLLHSTGKFYGAAQFSNVKADINDMTADVIFNNDRNHTLFGKLDNQVVVLIINLPVKEKELCEINLSCENVSFPDQYIFSYGISHLSNQATFIVKDSRGEVVWQDNLRRPGGTVKYVFGSNVRMPHLGPGSYSVTVVNPETRTALAGSATANYTISKGTFGLRIVVFNETYPDEVECIVHADVSMGLNYNLTVTGDSGVVYSKKVGITQRMGHFDIGTLHAGNYTATITCLSDDYLPVSNSTTFVVSPRGTSFEVEINASEITYGETATVTPVLQSGATGNITYYLNNGTFLGKLAYNENLILPILDAGSYVIIANYSGDIDDLPAFDSVHLIVNKVNTVFEVRTNVSEITYGETATVMPILPANATGTIKYYLADGTVLGELAVGENLTLPVWDAGYYVIYADYSGDRNFVNATANVTLPVNQVKTVFEIVAGSFIYDEIAIVTHTLSPGATGTIKYYLSNGTFITELPVNENLTLILWDAGTYDIVANYTGDRNFLNATANAALTINKAKTEIKADPVIVMYNSNGNLLIILKDVHDYPLCGFNVTVDWGGVKNYTTDKEGLILLSTNNIRVGKYNVVVSFNGNDNYLNCSRTTSVTVTKMIVTMTANPLVTVYQVHKYLVINLKDDLNKPVANENVIIKINGVSYKCKTDAKGNARLIIRLDAKTYTAKVTFVNDNYFSATKYVKVTVLKAKPKIIAKKKTFKANKEVKKYTVTLKDNNGKAIKKAKLTIKIGKKTYKAKTNSKGKAVFKIKNLTKKGKYTAKITYKGNYLYKKATKKVKITVK